jgi:hypothetical protein
MGRHHAARTVSGGSNPGTHATPMGEPSSLTADLAVRSPAIGGCDGSAVSMSQAALAAFVAPAGDSQRRSYHSLSRGPTQSPTLHAGCDRRGSLAVGGRLVAAGRMCFSSEGGSFEHPSLLIRSSLPGRSSRPSACDVVESWRVRSQTACLAALPIDPGVYSFARGTVRWPSFAVGGAHAISMNQLKCPTQTPDGGWRRPKVRLSEIGRRSPAGVLPNLRVGRSVRQCDPPAATGRVAAHLAKSPGPAGECTCRSDRRPGPSSSPRHETSSRSAPDAVVRRLAVGLGLCRRRRRPAAECGFGMGHSHQGRRQP